MMGLHALRWSTGCIAFLALATVSLAQSQGTTRVRQLDMSTRVASGPLGAWIQVAPLRDGRVMVNLPFERRLLMLDAGLSNATVIADSTPTHEFAYGRFGGRLLAVHGDTAMLVDPDTYSIRTLHAGRLVATSAYPRPREITVLSPVAQFESWADTAGRLFYARPVVRAGAEGGGGMTGRGNGSGLSRVDSAVIMRMDPVRGITDSIAQFHFAQRSASLRFEAGRNSMTFPQYNPLAATDAWTVLSDAAIAIVRGADYHVEIIRPDGRRVSAPKIPFAWHRLNDDAKAAYIDSLVRERSQPPYDSARIALASMSVAAISATRSIVVRDGHLPKGATIEYVPASELPDYVPAFDVYNAIPDRTGRLWLRMREPGGGSSGPVYDVIDGEGKLVDRVQLPAGRNIIGFGANTVFISASSPLGLMLERVRLP